jgi:hypothetical protein
MSRNIRISRLGQAPGLGESTLGRNRKIETLAAKTTMTKALLALVLICSGQSAWSYTVSGNTYTTNGSLADVQSACTAAPDNGSVTVLIPNGTYSWSGTLTITRSLNLAGASSTGVIIRNTLASGDMIDATSSANGNVNIYWLDLQQIGNNAYGTGYLMTANRTEPSNYTVMIHDCTLDSTGVGSYIVQCLDNGILFWNDNFPSGNTGIYFFCDKYGPGTNTGSSGDWNAPDSYGTEDTTGLINSYVENCSFAAGSQYLLDIDDNSRVVFRYNTVQDSSIGSHGQESSPYGCREWEIYNNKFNITTGNPFNVQCWFTDRGGAGVIWGNSMEDVPYGKTGIQFCVFSINIPGQIPCQTSYPAARQVGQGWSSSSSASYGNPVVASDGKGQVTAGVFIWGNTGAETTDPNYVGLDTNATDGCGNGQSVTNYVAEGRDYFFTAKPGYTPYTYPHPLHTKYAIGGTPTPSPTPTPAPTPLAPQDLRVQ